jgi:hypothetical protein
MKHLLLLALLLLALPCVHAQDQLTPERFKAYLAHVDELQTEIEWDTGAAARREFNAERIRVRAQWRRPAPGAPAALVEARLEAVGSRRLQIPGTRRRVRSLTIQADGKIRAHWLGPFTLTFDVQRTRDGGLELELPLVGRKRIEPAVFGGGLSRWPPSLEDMIAFREVRPQGRPTGGRFRWTLHGWARAFPFDLPEGRVEATSELSMLGQGRIERGALSAPLGSANWIRFEAQLAGTRLQPRGGGGAIELRGGQLAYEGLYGLLGDPRGLALSLEGDLDYSLELGRVEASVGGGQLALSSGQVRGQGPLRARLDGDQLDVDASGGEFSVETKGPVVARDVAVGDARLNGALDAELRAEGQLERADLRGLGMKDVLLRGVVRASPDGARADVGGARIELASGDAQIEARGAGSLDADGPTLTASGTVEGASGLRASAGSIRGRADASYALDVDVRREAGADAEVKARGKVQGTVEADGIEAGAGAGTRVATGTLRGSFETVLELDRGGVRGKVDATLTLTTATLRHQSLEAKLVGAAQAKLAGAAVRVDRRDDGGWRAGSGLAVPLRIELSPGTRVEIPGRLRGTLTRAGSVVTCVAKLVPDDQRGLRLSALEQVTATIEGAGLRAGGVDLPSNGFLRLAGRVALRPGGLDLYGELSAGVRSRGDEPALRLRWR